MSLPKWVFLTLAPECYGGDMGLNNDRTHVYSHGDHSGRFHMHARCSMVDVHVECVYFE